MGKLIDITKRRYKIELCKHCDPFLFPSGRFVSPDDARAKRQKDGSLKCGICVERDAKKLLALFSRIE